MKKAFAKIKGQKTSDHVQKPFMDRLVKAVQRLNLFKLRCIDATIAAVDIAGLATSEEAAPGRVAEAPPTAA